MVQIKQTRGFPRLSLQPLFSKTIAGGLSWNYGANDLAKVRFTQEPEAKEKKVEETKRKVKGERPC